MNPIRERATDLLNSGRDLLALRSVAALLWPILLFWIAQSDLLRFHIGQLLWLAFFAVFLGAFITRALAWIISRLI